MAHVRMTEALTWIIHEDRVDSAHSHRKPSSAGRKNAAPAYRGGTRRAATGTPACTNRTPGAPPVTACAPCRWPPPHFSCDHDGLLRRVSTRTRRVVEKVHE